MIRHSDKFLSAPSPLPLARRSIGSFAVPSIDLGTGNSAVGESESVRDLSREVWPDIGGEMGAMFPDRGVLGVQTGLRKGEMMEDFGGFEVNPLSW